MTGDGADPQTDVGARLREIRKDIDALLDGQEARSVDQHSAGTLDEINGVIFALNGRETDVRVTQEGVDEPPAPSLLMLGYLLDGLAATSGHPPLAVARYSIDVLELAKQAEGYDRTASATTEDVDD